MFILFQYNAYTYTIIVYTTVYTPNTSHIVCEIYKAALALNYILQIFVYNKIHI